MIAKHIFEKTSRILTTKGPFINNGLIAYQFANVDTPLDSKQKIEILKKQTWFQDYQTATKYNSQQKYTDALKHYYKVIQTMQEKNQKGQAYYYKIFEKVLKINVLLDRPLQTQQNLYKLIKVKKTLQKNPILVYEDYQNLMIHQLNHNVEKSIKLGKALLSESQINNLPINNEKHIRMLLGNAYLLVDNFADAKKKYGEVLEMKPSFNLRGKTLNNLGIACWWHKNPMFALQQQVGEYEEVRINRDFKQTKQLLMNSIGALQNIDQLSQAEADALQSLLNQNPDSMLSISSKGKQSNGYLTQYKDSLQPIYNLIQYYIYNDPIQKPLILAWMRILLKAASRFSASNLIDEVTLKYYLLNNDVAELKKALKTMQTRFQTLANKSIGLSQKVHLLQGYKMMNLLNKVTKEQQFKVDQSKIKSLQKEIVQKDPFIFKRQLIMSQQLSFMKRDGHSN